MGFFYNKYNKIKRYTMNEHKIQTIFGHFKDNILTTEDSIISCLTYNIVRKEIQDKSGYFNLQKNQWGDWVIFQYILV